MKITKAGYLGYFLKIHISENPTTEIYRSQGPVQLIFVGRLFIYFIFDARGQRPAIFRMRFSKIDHCVHWAKPQAKPLIIIREDES